MEIVKGTIVSKVIECKVSEKTGKEYTRAVFVVNGKNYSTFDKDIYEGFKTGDNISMTGEQKGEYWNMLSMSLATAETTPMVSTPANVQPEEEKDEKHAEIISNLHDILHLLQRDK